MPQTESYERAVLACARAAVSAIRDAYLEAGLRLEDRVAAQAFGLRVAGLLVAAMAGAGPKGLVECLRDVSEHASAETAKRQGNKPGQPAN